MLGTDELFRYLDKYSLELDDHHHVLHEYIPRMAWSRFVTPQNQHLVSNDALDLLGKLLRYDHQVKLRDMRESDTHENLWTLYMNANFISLVHTCSHLLVLNCSIPVR